jgi:hypothetical protein
VATAECPGATVSGTILGWAPSSVRPEPGATPTTDTAVRKRRRLIATGSTALRARPLVRDMGSL